MNSQTGSQMLVGRDAELARINSLLEGLQAGGAGGVARIAGEAGIGKSRLLADLIDRADTLGLLCLDGRAGELEVQRPFAVFADAIEDYLASVNPSALARLGPEQIGELAPIFPSLDPLAATPPSHGPEERFRTHRALAALIGALSARKPLVLCLDDFHWADPASVELLAYLARRGAGPRLLTCDRRPAARAGHAVERSTW